MPLCCIENDNFSDYLTGETIRNKNTLEFIKMGLKRKKIEIKFVELQIFTIKEYILPTYDKKIIAYNYCINGCNNYLDTNKQPLDRRQEKYIVDGLMNGKFIQEVILK